MAGDALVGAKMVGAALARAVMARTRLVVADWQAHVIHMASCRVENSAQVSYFQLRFVYGMSIVYACYTH